jgi:hypothetical protein
MLGEVSNALSDRIFLTAMVANVRVSGVKASDRCQGIDAAQLAQNWGIGLHMAEKTLKVTTLRGIRTLTHPSLSRWFRTQDRQLRFRRLPIKCFTNTLIAKSESRSKNKYAQVFCTAEGWTRAFPMRTKSQAHEALLLLHKRDGVPSIMVVDGAREQVHGDFRRKNREVGTHIKETEPHSP